MPTSPTARRRRLGIELRRLREAANLNGVEVTRPLGWSATKLSRIETGRVAVHHGDVGDLLDLYNVADESLRQHLITLARESRQKGWWHRHRDTLKAGFDSYIGLESDASIIMTYQAQVVPGLLQTEAYARAVIEATAIKQVADRADEKVDVRLSRQQLLTHEAPVHLHAVLDEAVLRREVGGPAIMAEQLTFLVERAGLPNVTIQVLPFRAGAHSAMDGPFIILRFPDSADPDIVYLEQATSGLMLEDAGEIDWYTRTFSALTARALSADESARLISRSISS
ncbi:helix-turn-helix domain-containing protein [Sphaerimonospora thailandensis]|uniref:Transcriptional regulator n=1 Tax=Sphaerimonospora thailandensis TaxID=795644 RepID=A0A8J3R781_9ACTN|nr:helix-turn-helix transcriptional regulator [Sphaerimonospora thailandensis]GIH69269.1 transcriptional regulator [Sphaerimonospora thailandensis]